MRLLALCIAALGSPVFADSFCDELWFTRNLVFDRAGYCFGSTLGQSVFDNRDCISQDVSISPPDKVFVDEVRVMESEFNCAVDTGRRALTFHGQSFRRAIAHLPLPSEFESACLGWKAATENLRAGRSEQAAVVGQILQGDNVTFSHVPIGNWEFVQIYRGDVLTVEGWVQWAFNEPGRCEGWAG